MTDEKVAVGIKTRAVVRGEIVDLLPCPFCGQPGKMITGAFGGYRWAAAGCETPGCICEVDRYRCRRKIFGYNDADNMSAAKTKWNRRAA
jgi:hypothetical protein